MSLFKSKQQKGGAALSAGRKPSRLRRRLALALVLILIAGAAALFLLRPKTPSAAAAAEDVSTVQSATAETGTVSSTVSATGSIALTDTKDVTMPSGLEVEEVCVEVGDEVKKGDTLAKLSLTSVVSALVEANDSLDDVEDTLDDDDDLTSLEKELLNSEISDLEEEIETLEALHDNPVITASCDGIVGSIYVSETGDSSSSNSTSTASSVSSVLSGTSADVSLDSGSVTLLGTAQTQPVISLLSDVSAQSADSSGDVSAQSEDSSSEDSSSDSSGSTSDGDDTASAEITDYAAFSVTAPVTGETPQSEITETDCYTGTITWNCSGVFQAETAYTATITLKAKDGYVFTSEELPTISGASYDWSINEKANRLFLKVTFEKTAAAVTDPTTGTDDTLTDGTDTTLTPSTGTSGISGYSSGSVSGFSSGSVSSGSVSSSSGSSSATSSVYSNYETVAFTIQKQEKAVISVSIDELDILSLEEGQTAEVTLDAIEGETFEGTITSISTSGTSSGGSAKYTVEITVALDDQMRSGMSASVVINTGSTEDAVLIPVSALQESGDSTFVYTEVDEDGNLSGEVEVTTGLSDSTNVEITSGLSDGDTVYYTRTISDAASDSTTFSFGDGEMPSGDFPSGGGDMPSGGTMPSGGGQGGQPS